MLQRYITRPFEVSAMVYTGRNSDDIMSTFQSEIINMNCKNGCLQLKTTNGYAVIGIGDYLVQGRFGDLYVCPRETFEAIYQPLTAK